MRELFPLLLHDLFGYQNLPNWGLHFLEPRAYPSDYNAMKMFLGPKGTIFKIIDKLMTDHDAMFQLPYEILPVCINIYFVVINVNLKQQLYYMTTCF